MNNNRFRLFSIDELNYLRQAFMTQISELEWASLDTSLMWEFVEELDEARGHLFNSAQED